MPDCGGRNYEDESCALFSLSNQRPVIFSAALKEEIGEQVSWRALFYLCRRDCAQGPRCVSHELISISAFAFVLMNWSETGRSHLTPGHGEQTRRWRCCTGASGWTEPRCCIEGQQRLEGSTSVPQLSATCETGHLRRRCPTEHVLLLMETCPWHWALGGCHTWPWKGSTWLNARLETHGQAQEIQGAPSKHR